MKRITVGYYVTPGHAGDKEVLGFSTGLGGAHDDVAVEFYVENSYDVPPSVIDSNTRIASGLLEAELVKGESLRSHYQLSNGRLIPQ